MANVRRVTLIFLNNQFADILLRLAVIRDGRVQTLDVKLNLVVRIAAQPGSKLLGDHGDCRVRHTHLIHDKDVLPWRRLRVSDCGQKQDRQTASSSEEIHINVVRYCHRSPRGEEFVLGLIAVPTLSPKVCQINTLRDYFLRSPNWSDQFSRLSMAL